MTTLLWLARHRFSYFDLLVIAAALRADGWLFAAIIIVGAGASVWLGRFLKKQGVAK